MQLKLKLSEQLAVSSFVKEEDRVGVAVSEGTQDVEGVSEELSERVPENLKVFPGVVLRELVSVGESEKEMERDALDEL